MTQPLFQPKAIIGTAYNLSTCFVYSFGKYGPQGGFLVDEHLEVNSRNRIDSQPFLVVLASERPAMRSTFASSLVRECNFPAADGKDWYVI